MLFRSIEFSEKIDLTAPAKTLIKKIRSRYNALQKKYGSRTHLHIFYNGFIGFAIMLGREMPQTFKICLHDYDGVTETYQPAICLNRSLFQNA